MATTEPNSGIVYGWGNGSAGWDVDNDANLKMIGRLAFGLSVIDRDLTAPPVSPADGDRYIVAASATGDWAGHDGKVAVWDGNISAWAIYAPAIGWTAYVEDEDVKTTYKSTGWSVGVAC